MTKMLCCCYNR